jgi:hypothetical protein
MEPPLAGDVKGYTPEEEFVAISLKSREFHARAKLILLQLLNQIHNPEKNITQSKIRILDYTKTPV